MNHNITGLIIAAGLSNRMGDFKPLLEYKGKKFIERIIDNLLPHCSKIVIITGNRAKSINDFITTTFSGNDVIELNHNNDFEKGMFSSLKKGIEELTNQRWILYHFVDQPNLPEEFYAQFITQIEDGCDWIQPTFNGHKGHPILFNHNVANKIITADESANMRILSNDADIRKKYWECDFDSIFTDIDTQNDFNKLKKEE